MDAAAFKVVAVKAAVANCRAYDRIASATRTVDTPGRCSSNLRSFAFRQLRRPVCPLDAVRGQIKLGCNFMVRWDPDDA